MREGINLCLVHITMNWTPACISQPLITVTKHPKETISNAHGLVTCQRFQPAVLGFISVLLKEGLISWSGIHGVAKLFPWQQGRGRAELGDKIPLSWCASIDLLHLTPSSIWLNHDVTFICPCNYDSVRGFIHSRDEIQCLCFFSHCYDNVLWTKRSLKEKGFILNSSIYSPPWQENWDSRSLKELVTSNPHSESSETNPLPRE